MRLPVKANDRRKNTHSRYARAVVVREFGINGVLELNRLDSLRTDRSLFSAVWKDLLEHVIYHSVGTWRFYSRSARHLTIGDGQGRTHHKPARGDRYFLQKGIVEAA